MDNQQFLDIAFKNLPGGLILVDLRGRVRAMNETAELLLGLTGKVTPGDHCRNVLDTHPKIVRVLWTPAPASPGLAVKSWSPCVRTAKTWWSDTAP